MVTSGSKPCRCLLCEKEAIPSRQPTEECIHVLTGSLRVELESVSYVLNAGDSITFDGMAIRCLTVIGDQKTEYLSFSIPLFV